MKISVVGFYGKGNVGDESYRISMPLAFPEHELIFSDHPIDADCYFLGGGDVLSSSFLNLFDSISGDKYAISVTATESFCPKIKNFKKIIVRDTRSANILKSAGINCETIPDLGFLLKGNCNRGKTIIKKEFVDAGRDLYEKVVGVIINAHLTGGHDIRDHIDFHKFSHGIASVADKTPASFLFLPFSTGAPWDDRVPGSWTGQRCKFWKKNLAIMNKIPVVDILDIISGCDAVISTRLHSTIFCISSGTPFIDVVHNHKNSALLKDLGMTGISYRGFDPEVLRGTLMGLLTEVNDKTTVLSGRELKPGEYNVCVFGK